MAVNRVLSELQVGLLTIAAVVILITGMLWLKNIDLTKGSLVYQVDFSRVEGMQVGDRVQVRGIRMGEVSGMTIMQESVRVEIKLEDGVDLREDAQIILGEKGIVGEIVLEIDPGTGPEVKEGHIFKGRTAGTIAAMTDAAGSALAEMRILTGKVSELVEEVKKEGMVVETLTQANETLAKVDDMIESNHSDVKVILENVLATTEALRTLMESGKLDRMVDGTSQTMARADSMMVTLGTSVARLDTVMALMTDGNGTAAKLLHDPMLYDRADSTLASVKRLVDAMRRNPKRFVKLNVVDF
jgi:phospholipid/cholesterol/gamma-HCH transport system substrate-binding protein|nr:MlaD family protein [Candidatus Krumholzibacteria bacterium]